MKKLDNIAKVGIIAVVCSLVIGGSLITAQNNKQASIERQNEAKLQVERDALAYQRDQDLQADIDKALNKTRINLCLEKAEDAYWEYMELNGTGERYDEKGVYALTRYWDTAEENKKDDIDNCYRKFK